MLFFSFSISCVSEMKRDIWIFLLAVLLPSVVLGWLALRSAEEQQIILEKRTAELYQKETENVPPPFARSSMGNAARSARRSQK